MPFGPALQSERVRDGNDPALHFYESGLAYAGQHHPGRGISSTVVAASACAVTG